MKKQWKKSGVINASLFFALTFLSVYIVVNTLPRIGGITKMPSHQVIREQENVCVLFVSNSGASEEAMIATAYCHELQKELAMYRSFADVWKEKAIISWETPMECPMVTVKYEKQHKTNIITFKRDPVCHAFTMKNPLKTEEVVKIRYIVNKEGQLVEVEKKSKPLKPAKEV